MAVADAKVMVTGVSDAWWGLLVPLIVGQIGCIQLGVQWLVLLFVSGWGIDPQGEQSCSTVLQRV